MLSCITGIEMKTLVHSYQPTKHSLVYGGEALTDTLKQRFRVMVDNEEIEGEITVCGELITVIVKHPKLLSDATIIDIYKLSVFSSKGLKYIRSSELPLGYIHTLQRQL